LSASSLSVALTVRSISSRVAPSIVAGMWVGNEVGRPEVTVTTPSDFSGASVAEAGCAVVCAKPSGSAQPSAAAGIVV
jgi:hypothetical protein